MAYTMKKGESSAISLFKCALPLSPFYLCWIAYKEKMNILRLVTKCDTYLKELGVNKVHPALSRIYHHSMILQIKYSGESVLSEMNLLWRLWVVINISAFK